jgi:hypothetical protein
VNRCRGDNESIDENSCSPCGGSINAGDGDSEENSLEKLVFTKILLLVTQRFAFCTVRSKKIFN